MEREQTGDNSKSESKSEKWKKGNGKNAPTIEREQTGDYSKSEK